MKITGMQTNHLTNPLGHELQIPRVSFQVEDTASKRPEGIRIKVAADEAFDQVIYDTGKSRELSMIGTDLPIALTPRTRYYWRAEVWGDAGDYALSETAWFETAKQDEPWTGVWIGADADFAENLVLTKEFEADRDFPASRFYVSGLGLYELYLDGERVGEEYLAPGCTDYHRWIQYQTYEADITAGSHTIEVWLGDGWYRGRFGLDGAENVYGDRQQLILELVLRDGTGTEQIVATDESWTVHGSDVRFSNIYDGEIYEPGAGDRAAHPAVVLDAPAGVLSARYSQPVRIMEERHPVEILHTPAGETVLDLGQNMAGFLRFYVDEPKGTRLHLQFGEVLQQGNFYRENLKTAKAEFIYVSDGTPRWVQPHFTYYGFRYVKLEGFTGELKEEQFIGCVLYSALTKTGSICTSSSKVNQLISNVFWGQKSNYIDVPTDCPQRSERMGWTADTQVFSGTACFNMDSYNFLRKYCHDLYETQLELGHVTSVVPAFHEDGPTCSVWGDAATLVPWNLYLYYGDVHILEEQFDSMCQWVDYIRGIDEATGGRRVWDVGFHFGDWLALDNEGDDDMKGATEDGYIATAYYYQSAQIVAKAARILGKETEAEAYGQLAEEIRAALQAEYFTKNGRLAMTTQTAYAVALSMDFAPEGSKARLAEFLKEKLKVNKGYLKTGFVGTYLLSKALSDYGNNELAYKLLLNEDFPSWLYEVNMGATTVWERWNSILPDGSISSTGMNSLNHYAYGSVLEWMYRNVAGLHVLEEHPGFTHVRIAPQPDYRITSCEMTYHSIAGAYAIAWELKEDGAFSLRVQVPFNATAEIVLPNTSGEPIRVDAGSYEYDYVPEIPILKIFSSKSPFSELLEDAAAKQTMERFIPGWEIIPKGMLDMPVEILNDTPFVNLSEEELEAFNLALSKKD